jgi:hypothetical protein
MNMGGLLCVASLCRDIPQTQRNRRGNYLLCIAAASLFALAVLTKITDLFGVVASVLFLLRIRQILPATLLCAITALFAIAGFLCFNLLSHGQMLENFHACANAGRSVLSIRHWFSILHEVYLQDDWIGTLLMATALLAWLISTVNEKLSLPGLFLIVAISMTVPMYFSPGLSINHLLDAEAASAIYLGFHLSRVPNSTRWWIATTALFLCSIFRFSQPRYLKECFYHRTDAFRSAVLSADPTGGPVLSDHALVPVTVGQSPFLLDDYTFPSVRASHPDAQDDLYHRLDTAYFGAVVLRYDPSKGDRPAVFGKNFQTVLLRRYQLLSQTNFWDHLWIYGRRNDPPPAP